MVTGEVHFRPSLSWFAAQVVAGVIFLLLVIFTARVFSLLTVVLVCGVAAYCALEWWRLRLSVSADSTGLYIGDNDPVYVPWSMVTGVVRSGQRFRSVGRAVIHFSPELRQSEAARRLGLWIFPRLSLPYMVESADTVVSTLEYLRREAAAGGNA